MKKVLKVGLPIAASLIPGIGPLVGIGAKLAGGIGAAAGAAGGLLNSRGGSSSSGSSSSANPDQLATNQALRDAIAKQGTMSQGLIDQGKPLVGQGAGYMTNAGDYFKNLLGGGEGLNRALAGPISDLRTGSQAQLQNIAKFAPRGNTAQLLGDQQSQLGSQIARLRFGAQSGAASSLAGIGQGLLGSGVNLQTGATGGMNGILQALLGQQGQQNQLEMFKSQQSAEKSGAFGEGIGNLLGILLSPGGLLNKGKTSKPLSLPGKSGP